MDVFEEDDRGELQRHPPHELRGVLERAVANQARVAEHRLDVRARGEVEPDELADDVGHHAALVTGAQEDLHAGLELGSLDLGGVAFLNPESRGEQVPHERVLEGGHLLMGSAREHPHPLREELDRARELEHQAGLAEARVAVDRDHTRLPLLDRLVEHLEKCLELGLAADHPRLDTLYAPRGQAEGLPLCGQHRVDAHRLAAAANHRRGFLAHVEHAPDVAIRVVRDQDRAGSRQLLQPAGDVYGIAHHRRLPARAHPAHQHHPGVYANAHPQGASGELKAVDLALDVERGARWPAPDRPRAPRWPPRAP